MFEFSQLRIFFYSVWFTCGLFLNKKTCSTILFCAIKIWDKSVQELYQSLMSKEIPSLLISLSLPVVVCTEDTLLGHPFISLYVRLCVWVGVALCCAEWEYMLTYSSVNRKWLFPHRVWRLGQSSKNDGENMHWLRPNSLCICYTFVLHLSRKCYKGWLITGRKKKKKKLDKSVSFFSYMNSHIQPNPRTKAHPDKCTPWTSLFIPLKCCTGNTGYK